MLAGTMTMRFDIAYKEGITIVTMLQKVTREDLERALREIVANYSCKRRLWDFTKVEFNLSMEEMRKVSEFGKALINIPNKVAFAVGDPLAFGKVRQLMVYRAGELTIPGVFKTFTEAFAWLAEEDF